MSRHVSHTRWHQLLDRLDALERAPNSDLLRGLLGSVVGLFEQGADRRDLRMAHLALRESRRALEVFAPYRHVPKIAIFGSARTQPDQPSYRMAEAFAREIVAHGFMVITGAGGGIMEAAQGGAGAKRSFGLNIELPFEQEANRYIAGDPKLLDFRFFFTRKLFFLMETRALALFPGGFGTLDEGFEALTLIQTGKATPMPIVLMESENSTYWEDWRDYICDHLLGRGLISEEDLRLLAIHHSVESGVGEVLRFFRVFHSAHRHKNGVTLWTWRPLDDTEIERLNDTFADMMNGRGIERLCIPNKPIMDTDAEVLSCIDVPMNHRHQGRLRQLIDEINRL
ncbi:MAG: LOG family protein [Nitrospirae bacterium]|nr:LOG family protein [Nitrospirota bacterium]